MRAAGLAKVASQAEVLRLKGLAARQGRRVAYGAAAAFFAGVVLILAHVAGWQILAMYVRALWATLVLLGIDLVISIMLGIRAARSKPGTLEIEAENVRRRALNEARAAIALGALVPVASRLITAYRGRTPPRRAIRGPSG
jgi:arginine exporter protein ArgO